MCGIHITISATGAEDDFKGTGRVSAELRSRLSSRGPDHFGHFATLLDNDTTGERIRLCFSSTVLALRGGGVTLQPFQDEKTGSVLCWNGEAWAINGAQVLGNDGEAVFGLLADTTRVSDEDDHAGSQEYRNMAILIALRSVEGPFAFVYFDKPARRLYFGRDRLGRRSLLIHSYYDENTHLPQLALSSVSDQQDPRWEEVEADGIYAIDLVQLDFLQKNKYPWTTGMDTDQFIVSGIGPFNVSISPPQPSLLVTDSPSVCGLRDRLVASLRPRILGVPRPPMAKEANDTRIAILFSGGLDCTVIARLCHDLLPSQQGIDLINVAFENPRVVSHLSGHIPDAYEACPDRITGRKSFAELQRVCLSRAWRFIAVDVPYTETVSRRSEIISIMHPHNTEMDLSIATALYFSARGVGRCYLEDGSFGLYSTPARVLLSGLGADELFGGYDRHYIAFSRRGYSGLVDELRLDVARLGKRNLGRDDRVMAHWGKEVRFPFLDDNLVRWAMTLPAWEKCDFAHPEDGSEESTVEPAKRVLRLVALSLGMEGVAREKKRAIQFGARTAKMESGRIKGTATVS